MGYPLSQVLQRRSEEAGNVEISLSAGREFPHCHNQKNNYSDRVSPDSRFADFFLFNHHETPLDIY
jgi:hypothetical protein